MNTDDLCRIGGGAHMKHIIPDSINTEKRKKHFVQRVKESNVFIYVLISFKSYALMNSSFKLKQLINEKDTETNSFVDHLRCQ